MTSKILSAFAALLALTCVGCMQSHVDRHWGQSYREMVARQTADPEAAAVNAREPAPQGTDGVTAQGVVKKLRAAGKGQGGASLPLPMIVTDTESASGL